MTLNNSEHRPNNSYQVRIGHTSVIVTGRDQADAIDVARQRLCVEMPRMWDVIQTLETSRFEVKNI